MGEIRGVRPASDARQRRAKNCGPLPRAILCRAYSAVERQGHAVSGMTLWEGKNGDDGLAAGGSVLAIDTRLGARLASRGGGPGPGSTGAGQGRPADQAQPRRMSSATPGLA